MSRSPIDRSPDLRRLRDEGYHVGVRDGYLLLHRVPYLNSKRQVCYGVLIAALELANLVAKPPTTHVAFFSGEYPCHSDGRSMSEIAHGGRQDLLPGLVADHSFSAKPKEGPDANFYDKMIRYVNTLMGPARVIDPTVTANPGGAEVAAYNSVFMYPDTASSRAGIGALSARLALKKVVIVGVGGTGAYVLDLLAKIPIEQIHIIDDDEFLNHNAYRAPGAASGEQLSASPKKVLYFREIYSRMHTGIVAHDTAITAETVGLLQGSDFVFLCMDAGPNKRIAVDCLREWKIPFIDVGMGLNVEVGALNGMVSVTAVTPQYDAAASRISFTDTTINDDYATNIQTADMNALNAALAVMKWKQLMGFYHDLTKTHFLAYSVNDNALIGENAA